MSRSLTRRRGRLTVDKQKLRAEEHADSKFLPSSSDDALSANEIALGYKQLIDVERGWRTLKLRRPRFAGHSGGQRDHAAAAASACRCSRASVGVR